METESRRQTEREIDRISDLPEFILHQIISYLPPKDAARTRALSKTWLQSYSTSPFLCFDERHFLNSPEIRYPFYNFVKNTLVRYRNMNLRIHKFEVILFRAYEYASPYPFLDEALGLAFGNGVKELDISIKCIFVPYTLPPAIFDSPKMLTYLRLHHCMFPQNVVTTFTSKCKAIIFPFLKTLDLNVVFIDDGMLQKLLSSSPSLEKIVFFQVLGLKKFRVRNISKLKVLELKLTRTFKIDIEDVPIEIGIEDAPIEIDIEDAPSLCSFKCWMFSKATCLLKLGCAPNLRRLELVSVSISDNFLNELVTKSSFLEEMEIYECHGLERIDIVSASLKFLRFRRCSKLVEVKINAPSLLELDYSGRNMISLLLNNTPERSETHIYIDNSGPCQLSNAWLHQMGKLLKGATNLVTFKIFYPNQGIEFGTVHDLRVNPLPPEHQTESFMLGINQSSSFYAAFVETLFSNSRPTRIYNTKALKSFFAGFIIFIVSELITATGNLNCCSSTQTKCWRHYLEDIKGKCFEDSQNGWQPLPHESLPSESTLCDKKIRFNLKWYANLKASA